MKDLFDITIEINRRYIEDGDWVYAKGKKAEIELIKNMLQLCQQQSKDINELRQELNVLEPYKAYRRAEYALGDVRRMFELVEAGVHDFEDALESWKEAQATLKDSENYMKAVLDRISAKYDEEKGA